MGGHGTRYSQSDIDHVIKALKKGATMKAAIQSAGLSWTGFYEHMNAHPEVKLRVMKERGRNREKVENALFRAATEPKSTEIEVGGAIKRTEEWTAANVKAAQLYLYNTAPEDWRDAREAVPPDSREDALARRAENLSPEELAALRGQAADAIFAPVSDQTQ